MKNKGEISGGIPEEPLGGIFWVIPDGFLKEISGLKLDPEWQEILKEVLREINGWIYRALSLLDLVSGSIFLEIPDVVSVIIFRTILENT